MQFDVFGVAGAGAATGVIHDFGNDDGADALAAVDCAGGGGFHGDEVIRVGAGFVVCAE